MKSEAIIPYSEQTNTEVSENTSVMTDNDYETTPSWGGGPYNKPKEFVFNLVFSEDVLIVDYGRSTAATYDWGVFDIIYDEVNSYYSQNRSSEQISETLEKRLTLYMQENYQ